MRILLINFLSPFPPMTGGKLRIWSIAKTLKDRFNCEVRIVCTGEEDKNSIIDNIPIYEIKIPYQSKYYILAKSVFTGMPEIIYKANSKYFEDKVREIHEEFKPDIVQCEHIWSAPTVLKIGSERIYIVDHNVEWKLYERKYQFAKNPTYKIWYYIVYKKFSSFEIKTLKKFDTVFCVSAADMQLLTEMGLNNIKVIENGVAVDYYSKNYRKNTSLKFKQNKYELLFIGALDYKANVDAVKFIIEKLYPKIINLSKDIEFVIVGSNPPIWLNNIKKPKLKVYANVPDVRPYLYDADVFICPLRFGSGSRLKILEAFASKVPVVSTTTGAEGLEVVNEEHILLADDADNFIDKIEILLEDSLLRKKLISNAFRLVNERYSWDIITEKLYNIYREDIEKNKVTNNMRTRSNSFVVSKI